MFNYFVLVIHMISLGSTRVISYKYFRSNNVRNKVLFILSLLFLFVSLFSTFTLTWEKFPILQFWLLFIIQQVLSQYIIKRLNNIDTIKEIDISKDKDFRGIVDSFNNSVSLLNNGFTVNKFRLSEVIKDSAYYKRFSENLSRVESMLTDCYNQKECMDSFFYCDLVSALVVGDSLARDITSSLILEGNKDKAMASFLAFEDSFDCLAFSLNEYLKFNTKKVEV